MDRIPLQPANYETLQNFVSARGQVPTEMVANVCLVRKQLNCQLPRRGRTNTALFGICALATSQMERKAISQYCQDCPVANHSETDILEIAYPNNCWSHASTPLKAKIISEITPDATPDHEVEGLDFFQGLGLRIIGKTLQLYKFEEAVRFTPLPGITPERHAAIYQNALRIATAVVEEYGGIYRGQEGLPLLELVHEIAEQLRYRQAP